MEKFFYARKAYCAVTKEIASMLTRSITLKVNVNCEDQLDQSPEHV